MIWTLVALTLCLALGSTLPTEQIPLLAELDSKTPELLSALAVSRRTVQGRFLHITG